MKLNVYFFTLFSLVLNTFFTLMLIETKHVKCQEISSSMVFIPPTLEKLKEHIAFGLSVRPFKIY